MKGDKRTYSSDSGKKNYSTTPGDIYMIIFTYITKLMIRKMKMINALNEKN